jgi:hypothetical protein
MVQPHPRYRVLCALAVLSVLPMACSDSDNKTDAAASDAGTKAPEQEADTAVSVPETPTVTPDGGAAQDLLPSDAVVPDVTPAGLDAAPSLDGTATIDTATNAPDSTPDLTPPPLGKFGVVVMPDTQYYAAGYNDVFYAQTQWIAAQKTKLNVAAVFHVGDIVDTDDAGQWTIARNAMSTLDSAKIPYVLVPGNHDYSDGNRSTKINSYFGPGVMPWITGTMVQGQIENNYALIDIGPRQWLVIGLEFGPRDAVVAWADAVLKAYPDRPAIIVTHAYLYHDGTRYNGAVSPAQSFLPQNYGLTASQGINDGEQIYQKLVVPHPNVRMVFSGHDTGFARLASPRPDGTAVYQMLSDYQWYRIDETDYFGGGGYLRVLQFDYDAKQVTVQTYSPYLSNYLIDDQNQFVIGLD